MALTKYDLVNTEGLKGLNFNGDFLAFDAITDEVAQQLEGKTHVLKKKTPAATAKALAAATTAESK
jgi:hypothetical protein